MFPADELARMRADLLGTLPDTCSILTRSYLSDGTGGLSEVWAITTSNVACRLDAVPRTNAEINTGAGNETFQRYILTIPQSVMLLADQRVSIGGAYYNVVSVVGGSAVAVGRYYVEKVDAARIVPPVMPWYLTLGITPIIAYQPKGAASDLDSLVNLASPGIYNAAAGIPPTWAKATGWTFDGLAQYLTTGIVPASHWSAVVKWSGVNTGGYMNAFGVYNTTTYESFWFAPAGDYYNYGTGRSQGQNGATFDDHLVSGIAGISQYQGYLNGNADGDPAAAAVWATPGGNLPIIIGALNNSGNAANYLTGIVEAFILFDSTLSAAQMLALYTAMASL